MAHINYPSDFLSQIILLEDIITQVGKDGASGPLVQMLAINKIDLDEDNDARIAAIDKNNLFLDTEKTSQILCEQRNTLMKPIFKKLRGAFQFIKNLSIDNIKDVGDWGATISDSGKITYPKGTQERVDLFMLMKKKNDSYTTSQSPLQPYLTQNSISLSSDATNAVKALVKQTAFAASVKSSESYRQQRDNGWKKPLADVHKIGAFLKTFHEKETKELGIYGFVVVETKLATKKRTIKVVFGGKRLNKRIAIGDTIQNAGTTDMNLFKGKTIKGKPELITAGSLWIVTKGFSTISIKNLSATTSGKLVFIPAKKASNN